MHRRDQHPFADTPARAGDFSLEFRPAEGQDMPACWIARPHDPDPQARPLIAVHGVRRDARAQAELLASRAARYGRTVVAPLFDKIHWRGYQRAVIGCRADRALLRLLEQLHLERGIALRHFDLFGYSGGAQFAHRFAMLYPHRIGRLTLLAAGWYTFPDDAPFPYGLAAASEPTAGWSPYASAALHEFLRLPIRVCVGERDGEPDPLTRRGPDIDRQQGTNRLSRARNWSAALLRTARARGIGPDIQVHVLPDCGHDFRDCVERSELLAIAVPDLGPVARAA